MVELGTNDDTNLLRPREQLEVGAAIGQPEVEAVESPSKPIHARILLTLKFYVISSLS